MTGEKRINCRLPQTPRSPFAAASHYFDDVFARSAHHRGSSRPSIRRSSTSRSIGNRSDFESAFTGGTSTPGAAAAAADSSAVKDEIPPTTPGGSLITDDHVSQYVESQLERVRRRASMGAYEDEFGTQAGDSDTGTDTGTGTGTTTDDGAGRGNADR